MNIIVRRYDKFTAGHSIYEGYNNAFSNLGYNVMRWEGSNINVLLKETNYILMCTDHDMNEFDKRNILNDIIINSRKILCFVSGNWFPSHMNMKGYFTTILSDEQIKRFNNERKILYWSWGNGIDRFGHNYCDKFNKVISLPLAYDQFTYKYIKDEKWRFDVCICGKYIHNGIEYKTAHMKDWVMSLEKTGLKCGFFGMEGREISYEDEAKLIYNSRIALGLHDLYQNHECMLGLDFNERLPKSIGSNGFHISDYVWQAERLNMPVIMVDNKEEYHKKIFYYLDKDLDNIKKENREFMLKFHTYQCRVKEIEKYI